MKNTICLITLLLFAACCVPPYAAGQASVRLSNRTIEMRGEEYIIHKVSKGETLYAIAKAYSVSQEAIMQVNSLTKDVVRARQSLLIPVKAVPGRGSARSPVQPQQQGLQQQPKEYVIPQQREPIPGRSEREEQVISTLTDTIPATTILESAMPVGDTGNYAGDGRLREFNKNAPLNIAILLPLQTGGRVNDNFSDFYKGILLGLNALKAEGVSTSVRFLNTGASADKVQEYIRDGKLESANLIIGPVYPEAFEPVAAYAAAQGVPVVSPLGAVRAEGNPYVFEAAPAEETKYDGVFHLFNSTDKNLIVIDHVEAPDTAALAAIEAAVGDRASVLSYSGVRTQSAAMGARLNAVLDRERENIIYVPVSQASPLAQVLSHISSLNTLGRYKITVVGTPRWEWLPNFSQLDLFFKLNAHYPASYHADRSDPAVAGFYQEYMDAFGSLPSPYSFRGYDIVRYFGSALHRFGSDMPQRISDGGHNQKLLQVDYGFRGDSGGKYRNIDWPIVNYRSDFTIEVK